jgi:hypothetical protein
MFELILLEIVGKPWNVLVENEIALSIWKSKN